jgi:hypothetical protein
MKGEQRNPNYQRQDDKLNNKVDTKLNTQNSKAAYVEQAYGGAKACKH